MQTDSSNNNQASWSITQITKFSMTPVREHIELLKNESALSFSLSASVIPLNEFQRIRQIYSPVAKNKALQIGIKKQIPSWNVFNQNAPYKYAIYQNNDATDDREWYIRLTFTQTKQLLQVYDQLIANSKQFYIKKDDIHAPHIITKQFVLTNVKITPQEHLMIKLIEQLQSHDGLADIICSRKKGSDFCTPVNSMIIKCTEKQSLKIQNILKDPDFYENLESDSQNMELKQFRPPRISHCSKCNGSGHNKLSCKAKNKVCSICNQSEHTNDVCPLRSQTNVLEKNCVACKKQGHWATNCPEKKWKITEIKLRSNKPTQVRSQSVSSPMDLTNETDFPTITRSVSVPQTPKTPKSVTFDYASTTISFEEQMDQMKEHFQKQIDALNSQIENQTKRHENMITQTNQKLEQCIEKVVQKSNDAMRTTATNLIQQLSNQMTNGMSQMMNACNMQFQQMMTEFKAQCSPPRKASKRTKKAATTMQTIELDNTVASSMSLSNETNDLSQSITIQDLDASQASHQSLKDATDQEPISRSHSNLVGPLEQCQL